MIRSPKISLCYSKIVRSGKYKNQIPHVMDIRHTWKVTCHTKGESEKSSIACKPQNTQGGPRQFQT